MNKQTEKYLRDRIGELQSQNNLLLLACQLVEDHLLEENYNPDGTLLLALRKAIERATWG